MSFAKQQYEAQFEYGEEVDAGGASVPQGIPPVVVVEEESELLELAHAGSDSDR